jgi:hypothetical protein
VTFQPRNDNEIRKALKNCFNIDPIVKVARTIMIILQAHTGVLCVLLLIYIYSGYNVYCVVEFHSEQVKLKKNFFHEIYINFRMVQIA